MSDLPRTRWDRRYGDGDWADLRAPAAILKDSEPWLPARGRALDLACGAGRNTVFLAERGCSVLGVDLSVEGLRLLRRRGEESGLPIQPVLGDVGSFDVRPSSFQVVVNTHFLLRAAFPLIRRALAPGGLLLFETYSVDEIDVLGGDIRHAYALERNELRSAFPEMEILLHEEGVFERPEGERGLARMIARKPLPDAGNPPGSHAVEDQGS